MLYIVPWGEATILIYKIPLDRGTITVESIAAAVSKDNGRCQV